jgi:uncharacterized protein
MNIQEDDYGAKYQINRYEPGEIWVNKQCYPNSIIIRPDVLLTPWRPKNLAELELKDFESIFADPPAIVLLGTGEKLVIPDQALMNALFQKGIGVEFMDTRAACHTFTVLAAEKRSVAACLLCL